MAGMAGRVQYIGYIGPRVIRSLNVSKPSTLPDSLYTRQLLFGPSFTTRLVISNSNLSCYSYKTFQTLHLKNIHFPSPSISNTPVSLAHKTPMVQLLLHTGTCSHLYQIYTIAQHTFQRSHVFYPLIHSLYKISYLPR